MFTWSLKDENHIITQEELILTNNCREDNDGDHTEDMEEHGHGASWGPVFRLQGFLVDSIQCHILFDVECEQ